MEIESVFLDTYAIYEIIRGNPSYERYTHGISAITTRLNLMELYYGLLLTKDKKTADRYYDAFSRYVVEVDDIAVRMAMDFKFANKDKRFSYVDCIGYIIARQRNIKFLTGDREFKNMPGVEYVK